MTALAANARAGRGALVVLGVALAARLAVVAWAHGRFPPAADGAYYHQLATRLAAGQGYTWLWPDGVVTPAAHYPVGYPALLAVGYAAFGASPSWGMVLNALIGAASALAVFRLARPFGERAAVAAGLVVALHPSLVFYTPALMTEGVAAALLLGAAATVAGGADRATAAPPPLASRALAGALLGLAVLVRPQLVAVVPVVAWLVAWGSSLRARLVAAASLVAVAALVIAPWTARNCRAMGACALVSVNGGWNLLIGAQTTSGAWQELKVPASCTHVFDEAKKDACFGEEAKRLLRADVPGAIARVPGKLAVTFDYFGAAPWYLRESNAGAFGDGAKTVLGAIDLVASRLSLALALVAAARRVVGARRRGALRAVAYGLAGVALISALTRHAAPAYLGLALLLGLGAPYARREALLPLAAVVIVAVAATHALFFGAGRYGLVVAPFVAAVAALVAKAGTRCQDDGVDADQATAGAAAQAAAREESPSTVEQDAG